MTPHARYVPAPGIRAAEFLPRVVQRSRLTVREDGLEFVVSVEAALSTQPEDREPTMPLVLSQRTADREYCEKPFEIS